MNSLTLITMAFVPGSVRDTTPAWQDFELFEFCPSTRCSNFFVAIFHL